MRFCISKRFENNVPVSERVTAVCGMFGVSIDRLGEHRPAHKCDIEVEDGDIVYITGPSGAGKSVLLREIEKMTLADERINIDEIELSLGTAVVDCVSGGATMIESLQLLGYAGLSDAFCILTAPANLSEGQQYRFRLACALASSKKVIFADEFCSKLDRITAACVAYNVRRFAERNKVTFFLASSREDILADLQPDVLVVKRFTGPAEVVYKTAAR